jgi:hypothetical protein
MLFILPQAARLSAPCGLAAFRPPVARGLAFSMALKKTQKGYVVVEKKFIATNPFLLNGYHLLFAVINVIGLGKPCSALF